MNLLHFWFRSSCAAVTIRAMMAALALALATSAAEATTRFWVGTGVGDWDDPANWSETVGGSGGASPPTSTAAIIQADALDRQVNFNLAEPLRLTELTIDATGTGTITLNIPAGVLRSRFNVIGFNGQGAIYQSGGSFISNGGLNIGQSPTSSGVYQIDDGSLRVAQRLNIGNNGPGALVQNGGTVHSDELISVGSNPTATGTYTLTAGTATAPTFLVGFSGIGEMLHSGGLVDVDTLHVGEDFRTNSQGIYRLSGTGRIDVLHQLLVGFRTTGTFIQTGGDIDIGLFLSVGNDAGGSDRFGHFELHDGTINTPATLVADRGNGTFLQTGGVHSITADLSIGNGSSLNNQPIGTYDMNGGQLSADRMLVGRDSQGRGAFGTFTQTQGTATFASSIAIADERSSFGELNLRGGTLRTPDITIGRGAGSMNLTGGTLHTAAIGFNTINNGATVAAYDATGVVFVSGDFEQVDGILSIGIAGNSPGINQSQLQAANDISLDGQVFVEFQPSFLPAVGDSFDIALAQNVATLAPTLSTAFNTPGYDGTLAVIDLTSGPNAGSQAIRLTITAVPEPSGISLVLFLLVGLAMSRWRVLVHCDLAAHRKK